MRRSAAATPRLVVIVTAIAVAVAAVLSALQPIPVHAQTPSLESVCANVQCVDHTAAFDPTYNVDPTTCSNGANCPTCLEGPEWEAILASMGAAGNTSTTRLNPLYVYIGNWLSVELVSTIAFILMKETMGYDVRGISKLKDINQMVCCSQILVDFESWRPYDNDQSEISSRLANVQLGYEGTSFLHIPSYTHARYPLMSVWNSLKYLPDYLSTLPRSFSTLCEYYRHDRSLPCSPTNRACEQTETWPLTDCVNGSYIPPVCEANAARDCREVMWGDASWDIWIQALMKTSGLNLTTLYIGGKYLATEIKRRFAAREDFIFYYWSPDPLVVTVGGVPIQFPVWTKECSTKHDHRDPKWSNVTCYPATIVIRKQTGAQMQNTEPDFRSFFNSFGLSINDINTIVGLHNQGGGNMSVYNASCTWVKQNLKLWRTWVRNTPDVVVPSSTIETWKIVVAVSVVSVLALSVAFLAVFWAFKLSKRVKAVDFAPRENPVFIMFTDIAKSTVYWQEDPLNMARALKIHNDTIRKQTLRHKCYEVKSIGDSFMIAGPSLKNMLNLAVVIQKAMAMQQWPEGIHIKLRIGIHGGETSIVYDQVNKGYDYLGETPGIASQLEKACTPREILITEQTFRRYSESNNARAVLPENTTVLAKTLKLRGVVGTVKANRVILDELSSQVLRGDRSFTTVHSESGENGTEGDSIGPMSETHAATEIILDLAAEDEMSTAHNDNTILEDITHFTLDKLFVACTDEEVALITEILRARLAITQVNPSREAAVRSLALRLAQLCGTLEFACLCGKVPQLPSAPTQTQW